MQQHSNTLVIITGPTGSGKTELSIKLAKVIGCEIISADSRQLFRDIPIGTAAPTIDELKAVKHHFIGTLGLDEYYSAARYEEDVMNLLPRLWEKNPVVIMCGGSMMYIDAVAHGVDDLPTVSESVRDEVKNLYEKEGLAGIRAVLRNLDPDYMRKVDLSNPRRIIHAIEISLEAGVPYSSLLTGKKTSRPFNIVKMMIDFPREELFDRINRRVDTMVEAGFIEEARRVYPLRHLNSLNTVGYKEMFAAFDGTMTLDTAIERMKKNTRVYAKKQLTWLKRDPSVIRLNPSNALSDAIRAIHHNDISSH